MSNVRRLPLRIGAPVLHDPPTDEAVAGVIRSATEDARAGRPPAPPSGIAGSDVSAGTVESIYLQAYHAEVLTRRLR